MKLPFSYSLLTLSLLVSGAAYGQFAEPVSVSISDRGAPVRNLSVSADGHTVVFTGNPQLYQLPGTSTSQLMVLQRGTGQVLQLSESAVPASNGAWPALSANGRFVVRIGNGMAGAALLRDLQTGVERDLTRRPDGTPANGTASHPSLSADGRFIVFASSSNNLTPSDADSFVDVYLWDGAAQAVSLVSVGSQATGSDGHSDLPSISDDGRFVAFRSAASNLVPNDTSGTDGFVLDRQTGAYERVNVNPTGGQSSSPVSAVRLSPDGRFVAFVSTAADLAPGAQSGASNLYVRDRVAGTTRWVLAANVRSDELRFSAGSTHLYFNSGTELGWRSFRLSDGAVQGLSGASVAMTGDGLGYVTSTIDRLVTTDPNVFEDLYFVANGAGTSQRLLQRSTPGMLSPSPIQFSVSDDGETIVFANAAQQLAYGIGQSTPFAGGYRRMSEPESRGFSPRLFWNGFSEESLVDLSADGQWAVVSGVINAWGVPLYLRNIQTGQEVLVARLQGSDAAHPRVYLAQISRDGRFVAYATENTGVQPPQNPPSGLALYLYDRITGHSRLISANITTDDFVMDKDGFAIDFTEPSSGNPAVRVRVRHIVETGVREFDPADFMPTRPEIREIRGTRTNLVRSPYFEVFLNSYLNGFNTFTNAGVSIDNSMTWRSDDGRLIGQPGFRGSGTSLETFVVVTDLLTGRYQLVRGRTLSRINNRFPGAFSASYSHVFFRGFSLNGPLGTESGIQRASLAPFPTGPVFQVNLSGYLGNVRIVPVVVEVLQNGVKVEELRVANVEGQGVMIAPETVGPATLRFSFRTGLRKSVSVVLGNGLAPRTINLINGDMTGDNQIDEDDFNVLRLRYDRVGGNVPYDSADLNGDGEVGAADFSILAANWGAVGD